MPIGTLGLTARLAQGFAEQYDIGVCIDVAKRGAGPVVKRFGVLGDFEIRLVHGRDLRLAVVDDALQILGVRQCPVAIVG